MIKPIKLLTLFFLLVLANTTFAQDKLSSKEEKKILEQAEFYYYDEDYQSYPKALDYFLQLENNSPNDPYYMLMVGICYTHFYDKKQEALDKLLKVKKLNPDFNEVNFYLARAYAINNDFDKAISTYELYLKDEDLDDDKKSEARQNIIYCQNAKSFIKDSVEVDIVNIGSPINTPDYEYVPIISPDETVMIYTYRGVKSKGGKMDKTGKPDEDGSYYEDVFISTKVNDSWSNPEGIAENINTNGHDASIALSVDGSQLFIYKSSKKDKGDIYVSKLEGSEWSRPDKIPGEVNSDDSWEGSASLTGDGKTLYFASNREGGLGGRDIYSATLNENNEWSNIQNLGPTINTQFDDDSPFIHPDGRTMYFSSKGHNSMGGYDIFYTYREDDGWDKPSNIGFPVNTVDDDRFYVLSADGKTGYYSTSGRSKDGKHDIYTVHPGHFGKKPILALVVGVVAANDIPVEADITVTDETNNEVYGEYNSNQDNGKYMLALTPGKKYKIAIEVEGYQPKVDYLDIESLQTYVRVEHDFKLYSKDKIENVAVANEEKLQEKLDKQISKYKGEGGTLVAENDSTEELSLHEHLTGSDTTKTNLIDDLGAVDLENEDVLALENDSTLKDAAGETITGLNFKVEIAAVQDTNDFALAHLEKYGKITAKTYPDGLTRYTFGPFSTLEEAEAFRTMLIAKEQESKDAFITVFVFGQRKTLEEYQQEQPCTQELKDFSWFVGKDLNDKTVYNKLIDMGGSSCADGLEFKVQIAAYRFPKNYKWNHLKQFGNPVILDYPDGITRFTQGSFTTIAEAEKLRQQIIKAGQKDAWITAFIDGKRMLLEELIAKNFFGKTIN